MKNMIPCKICLKNFDYVPGFAGNARQFCDLCRKTVDEKELIRLEDEMVIEKNRYLMNAPKRKNEYDPTEILIDGVIPVFTSAADRFVCTMEIATFVRKTGITGIEDGIVKFLNVMPPLYVALFFKQLDLSTMERCTKDVRFKNHVRALLKAVI